MGGLIKEGEIMKACIHWYKLAFVGVLFCSLLTGCGYDIIPSESEGTEISPSGRGVFAEKDGISIRITSLKSSDVPGDVEDDFSVFKITIDNQSEREVDFAPSDFRLFDSDRNQYDPISPAAVASSMPKYGNDRGYISFGYGLFGGHHHHHHGYHTGIGTSFGSSSYNDDAAEVTSQAFQAGKIESGAKKSGFLYFARLNRHEDTLRFVILKDGEKFLELPWRVVPR